MASVARCCNRCTTREPGLPTRTSRRGAAEIPSRALRAGAAEGQVLVLVDERHELGPRNEREPAVRVERRHRVEPGGKRRPIGDAAAIDPQDRASGFTARRRARACQSHAHLCRGRSQLQLEGTGATLPAGYCEFEVRAAAHDRRGGDAPA